MAGESSNIECVDAPDLKDRERIRYWRHEILLQLEDYVEGILPSTLPPNAGNPFEATSAHSAEPAHAPRSLSQSASATSLRVSPTANANTCASQFPSRASKRGRLGEMLLLLNAVGCVAFQMIEQLEAFTFSLFACWDFHMLPIFAAACNFTCLHLHPLWP